MSVACGDMEQTQESLTCVALARKRCSQAMGSPAHGSSSCPPLFMQTTMMAMTSILVGGLWERLDTGSLDGVPLLPHWGASWAAKAAAGWPIAAPTVHKAAYFVTHFPALSLHGMVFHW